MLVQILLSVFRATRAFSFGARISMRAIPRFTGSEEGPSLLPDWATEAVVGPVAVFAAVFASVLSGLIKHTGDFLVDVFDPDAGAGSAFGVGDGVGDA